jgi:hypothetical protein
MHQAEKEHKGYKKKTTEINKKVQIDTVPEWFDKTIDEEKLSDEEEAKMKAMLSEFS